MAPGGDVYKEILEPRPVFSNYDMPTASIDSTSSSLKRGAASSGGKPGSSTYDVHDLLECPVCMNLMCPPINQCPNGHTLCSHCKHRVHSCPTCRYELGNIRCLALERVAESLELPCRYQDMGCHDLFPYYTKLKHESNCRFRPFSCPYAGSECSITGDIPFLVMHLKEDHRVDMHNGCTFNHRYVKSNPHEVENATWMLTIFNCFGRQFCLHFEAFSLGMAPVYMAFLRFMGDDHDAKKFRYSLDVGRSGRKLGWQGIPRSIRESHRQVRDSLDGLIIHRDLALFFSGGDGQELKLKALAEDSRPGEKEYYERQFATLKSFEQVDRRLQLDSPEEDDDEEQAEHERAMKISNYANIVLLAFKIYATVRTGSLAIAASTLDSLLDLLAGAILWLTHLSMKNVNIYKYPIGKLRVQPVGIIVFAAIMATLGFQVLVEGVEQLIKAEPTEKMSSSQFIWLCVIMITATVVKFVLYLYCRSSGNDIVRAYAKDHYFDVVTNVVGLIAAIFGDKFYWWIDPTGAIILAIYTIINWSGTVMENAVSLVGQTAPPEVLQKLTYLVIRHPQVKRIDTIRAYTFGVLYFVEVDIELPEEIPLKEAHAIGEALQDKLEKLPEVERAFVHLDYECDHKPEHTVLSRLPNIDA